MGRVAIVGHGQIFKCLTSEKMDNCEVLDMEKYF